MKIRFTSVLALLLCTACTESGLGTGALPTGPVSDFSLIDLNPASFTSGEVVSPRDYLEQVSGWYFAHAT